MAGSLVVLVACLVIGVICLVVLTDNVVDHDGLTVIDRPWHQWAVAHRSPALTTVMSMVSFLGRTVVLGVLATAAVCWLLARRHVAHAVLVAAAALGAFLLVPLLKHVFSQQRPPVADQLTVETSWAYPSGHSFGSAAVLGALAVMAVVRLRRPAARVLVATAAAVLVLAIGVSRVYLGVHWPSDVLAGWLAGGLWLAFCLVLTSRWPRSNRHPPTLDPPEPERDG
jgi:membrane-associated phospholipid phosphatase